jgi:hypothetical protein
MGVGSPTGLSPVSSVLLNSKKRHVMFKKQPRQPSRIANEQQQQDDKKETTKQKE